MFNLLDLKGTFDIRFAISALYLWLLFGFLSSMVSCDLQRFMNDNILFRHFVGIIAFFLLFAFSDNEHKTNVFKTWTKVILVYFMFLLLTKSKWYFAIPVLVLLVIDQSIAMQIKYLEKNNKTEEKDKLEKYRKLLYKIIIIVVLSGFIHYTLRQYNEFGKDFSFLTLLFSSKCNLDKK